MAGALAIIAFMPAWATGHDLPRTQVAVEDRILSVPVPEGFGTGPIRRGLLLRPLVAQRAAYDMTLTIQPIATPAAGLPQVRRADGIVSRYRLDRGDGGSGGEEVTLTAERPCDAAVLRLVLRTRAEAPSDAILEPAWAVLLGTDCRR